MTCIYINWCIAGRLMSGNAKHNHEKETWAGFITSSDRLDVGHNVGINGLWPTSNPLMPTLYIPHFLRCPENGINAGTNGLTNILFQYRFFGSVRGYLWYINITDLTFYTVHSWRTRRCFLSWTVTAWGRGHRAIGKLWYCARMYSKK